MSGIEFRRPKPFDKSRYPYERFSQEEYQKRYSKVQKMMDEKGLDCLIVSGGNVGWERCWSNIRWLTNFIGSLEPVCYCIVPKEGDPTLCIYTHQIDRVARSVVSDLRSAIDIAGIAAGRVRELVPGRGRVGMVPLSWNLHIPWDHLESFKKNLPDIDIQFLYEEFWNLRAQKSIEEIKWIYKAALLGDLCLENLVRKAKPGITESQLFGSIYETTLSNGGENSMILIASTSMKDPDSPNTRARPLPRTLEDGFIINSEIGPVYNGYEAQTGKPITLGEPTQDYSEMFDVCLEAYKRISRTIRPGSTKEDFEKAGSIIRESGYVQIGAPILHGMHGGLPQDAALIPGGMRKQLATDPARPFLPLVIRPNALYTVEVSVATDDERKGVFLADSFLATDSAPRRLGRYEPKMTVV